MKEICTPNKRFTEYIYTVTAEVQFISHNTISAPYGWINIHQDGVSTTLWTQGEPGDKITRAHKVTASADIVANTTPNQLCFSGDVQEYSHWNGSKILAYPTKKVVGTTKQNIKLPGQDENNYVILTYQVKLKYDYTKPPTINLKNSDFERK
ncbi:TPA: hypothetical protein QCY71_005551 [Bacillus cereus]|nr:hypothetical protein [Bacillus cereus]